LYKHPHDCSNQPTLIVNVAFEEVAIGEDFSGRALKQIPIPTHDATGVNLYLLLVLSTIVVCGEVAVQAVVAVAFALVHHSLEP